MPAVIASALKSSVKRIFLTTEKAAFSNFGKLVQQFSPFVFLHECRNKQLAGGAFVVRSSVFHNRTP